MKPMLKVKRAEAGFTLIELMIVVAIIGVLAAVALPAYTQFTLKAKMSEAVTISETARVNMALAYNDGVLSASTTNTDLGLLAAGLVSSKYVASVTAVGTSTSSGTVTVVMQGTNSSSVDGKNVIYKIDCSGSTCETSIDAASTVPVTLLPKI